MDAMNGPLYFDELAVGDCWRSPGRTVTQTDIVNFACLTGDFNPLHVDHEFAKDTPFGRPVAHGLLGLSLVAGLGTNAPWASTSAFVGIRGWQFLQPIHEGDTLHVQTEVVSLTRKGRRNGAVVWRRRLVNQQGQVVQEGEFETLVSLAHTQTHDQYRTQVADLPQPAETLSGAAGHNRITPDALAAPAGSRLPLAAAKTDEPVEALVSGVAHIELDGSADGRAALRRLAAEALENAEAKVVASK